MFFLIYVFENSLSLFHLGWKFLIFLVLQNICVLDPPPLLCDTLQKRPIFCRTTQYTFSTNFMAIGWFIWCLERTQNWVTESERASNSRFFFHLKNSKKHFQHILQPPFYFLNRPKTINCVFPKWKRFKEAKYKLEVKSTS